MRKWANAMGTTFVIVFPHFVLQNHPLYANIAGIILAVIMNVIFITELAVRNPVMKSSK